ncbi:putative ER-retrevial receptor Ter1p, partial [Cardiosporidium cionae]
NLIHFLGGLVLLWKIKQQKTIYGLSFDTQLCFVLSTIARCMWSLDTRLVENRLAYLELFCSILAVFLLVYHMHRYRYTGSKSTWWPLQSQTLIPVALIAAFLFHPGQKWWSIQILVAFTMYLEAVALIPQLWLMHNIVEIETLTSHYVGLLILSRIVRMFFWLSLYLRGEQFIGLFVADLLHSICSVDYFFLWCHKLRRGGMLMYKT